MMLTRRELFQTGSAALAGAALAGRPLPAAETAATRRLSEGWEHYRGPLAGIWEVWRGKAAAANVTWDKVAMPHCFNAWDAVDPDRPYYQGPAWYRTTLQIDNPLAGGRTLLHFEGAGQNSEVFVGLDSIGRHIGGYDEFTFDIAGRTAEVQIAVLCDNSRSTQTIPSDQADFNRYGGLYRHVNLRYVPAISLERVLVDSTVDARGATVSVAARLHNPTDRSDNLRIETHVTDPSGHGVYTATQSLDSWSGPRQIATFAVPNPQLWSPKTPNLYSCSVRLQSPHGEHCVEERFGLRFFEFPPHGVFYLNGEKLFLRGTQRHEDHAGLGAAMTDSLIRREMQLIKQAGANFVRLAHYQQSRLVLDLCDELGLLVWEEIPWCRGGVGGDAYKEQSRRMLRNMIDQHRNHPAVVFWGLGNENDWPGDFETFDPKAVRAFLSELNGIAHHEDPSRLTSIRRCPFAKDVPDVYSPSIWAGWYSGRYTEYKSSTEKEVAGVDRMLHIEWGGDSHARRHSEDPDRIVAQIAAGQGVEEKDRAYLPSGGQARASRDGDWSETYICNLFDWHLKEQENMPYLAGAAQWVFKDFSTPGRPENPLPCINQKGLLERDLTPKEGYYVFQSWWAEKPMAHIYGHSWPVRWGRVGESKMVKVYSNCATAELFLNDKSCGVKERRSQDFPTAGLRWLAPFQPGENHLRVVARKGSHEVTDEIRFLYQTETWDKPAALVIEETARARNIVTLLARLLDAKGVPCLDARNVVRFSVAGDGELFENLGTGTGSRQLELYNGRAMIRVSLKGAQMVVGVSAGGVASGFCTIRA
ncbi:MAG: glycoside hydrolase family 2 TIM barrel-domain containing protein [Bryobacteraceae bacterium]|jgi:beta-galactosidase